MRCLTGRLTLGCIGAAALGVLVAGVVSIIVVATAGLAPKGTWLGDADICVGAHITPRLQVGVSVDACWMCASVMPYLRHWSIKACVAIPWSTRGTMFDRWGFEFPP